MLIRFDIADKFHARFLERRPSMRKAVFDDETEIGFGNDRPRITQAELAAHDLLIRELGDKAVWLKMGESAAAAQ